jgi:hypothetical protein
MTTVITTRLGEELQLGDRFMPTNHGWASFGEIVELLTAYPATRVFKVKRTARSGSVRTEVYAAPRTARFAVEVPGE